MKTIKSLPEYKALDTFIKKQFPKHELAIYYSSLNHSFQLIAVPKYTGFKSGVLSTVNNFDNIGDVYTFGVGRFVSVRYLKNVFQEIYWLERGLSMSKEGHCNYCILYIDKYDCFKQNLEFFKTLFNVVAYKQHPNDNSEIRFKKISNLRPGESDPYACATVRRGASLEEFLITNSLFA